MVRRKRRRTAARIRNKVHENGHRLAHDVLSHPMAEKNMGLLKCLQCGNCTATCPSSRYGKLNPRLVVGKVLRGEGDVIASEEIWNCFSCYACHSRCPRNNNPCTVIRILKQIAVDKGKGIEQVHKFLSYGESFLDYGVGCIPSDFFAELVSDIGEDWLKLKLNIDAVREEMGLGSMVLSKKDAGEVRRILERTGFTQRLERLREWREKKRVDNCERRA